MAILETFHYIGADMTLQLHNSHNLLFPQKTEGSQLLEYYIDDLKSNNIIQNTLSAAQCVDMINTIIYGFVYHWCLSEGEFNLLENSKKYLPEMLTFLK